MAADQKIYLFDLNRNVFIKNVLIFEFNITEKKLKGG